MSEKEALLPTKCVFSTNAPSEGAQMRSTTMQTICAVKSHLTHLQHSKSLDNHETKKLLELNV